MSKSMFLSLIGGISLLAVQAGGGAAQTVAVALNESPGTSPVLIDDPAKAPGNIPEIIRPSNEINDLLNSKATADPGSVLTPPSIDPRIFASGRQSRP
jgi:hypothetical protein